MSAKVGMDVFAVGVVLRLFGINSCRRESAGFTGNVTARPGSPGGRAKCPFPDVGGRRCPTEHKIAYETFNFSLKPRRRGPACRWQTPTES